MLIHPNVKARIADLERENAALRHQVQEQAAEIAQAKDALLGECYPVRDIPGDIAAGIRSTGAGWKMAEIRERERIAQVERLTVAHQQSMESLTRRAEEIAVPLLGQVEELAGKLAEAQKNTERLDGLLDAMATDDWTKQPVFMGLCHALEQGHDPREAIDAALKEPQEKPEPGERR
jgi:hypothetical protein